MAMSVATELQSSICEPRSVLGPGGNRVRVSEGPKHKYEGLKKPPQRPRKEIPESVVRKNVSVDSSCSSDTSSTGSSPKTASPRRTVRHKSLRPAKLVSNDVVKPDGPPKRCEWITAYSDPHYISFHDEEWGVPVYDDKKLFELLVLSQSLAELSWPEILTKRDIFRCACFHFIYDLSFVKNGALMLTVFYGCFMSLAGIFLTTLILHPLQRLMRRSYCHSK
ncbi:hypothetical protein ABKV19_019064 [Rosa sericea]